MRRRMFFLSARRCPRPVSFRSCSSSPPSSSPPPRRPRSWSPPPTRAHPTRPWPYLRLRRRRRPARDQRRVQRLPDDMGTVRLTAGTFNCSDSVFPNGNSRLIGAGQGADPARGGQRPEPVEADQRDPARRAPPGLHHHGQRRRARQGEPGRGRGGDRDEPRSDGTLYRAGGNGMFYIWADGETIEDVAFIDCTAEDAHTHGFNLNAVNLPQGDPEHPLHQLRRAPLRLRSRGRLALRVGDRLRHPGEQRPLRRPGDRLHGRGQLAVGVPLRAGRGQGDDQEGDHALRLHGRAERPAQPGPVPVPVDLHLGLLRPLQRGGDRLHLDRQQERRLLRRGRRQRGLHPVHGPGLDLRLEDRQEREEHPARGLRERRGREVGALVRVRDEHHARPVPAGRLPGRPGYQSMLGWYYDVPLPAAGDLLDLRDHGIAGNTSVPIINQAGSGNTYHLELGGDATPMPTALPTVVPTPTATSGTPVAAFTPSPSQGRPPLNVSFRTVPPGCPRRGGGSSGTGAPRPSGTRTTSTGPRGSRS